MTIEQLEQEVKALRRELQLLRNEKISNGQESPVALKIRIPGSPSGDWYELTVNDSGTPAVSLLKIGKRGL